MGSGKRDFGCHGFVEHSAQHSAPEHSANGSYVMCSTVAHTLGAADQLIRECELFIFEGISCTYHPALRNCTVADLYALSNISLLPLTTSEFWFTVHGTDILLAICIQQVEIQSTKLLSGFIHDECNSSLRGLGVKCTLDNN